VEFVLQRQKEQVVHFFMSKVEFFRLEDKEAAQPDHHKNFLFFNPNYCSPVREESVFFPRTCIEGYKYQSKRTSCTHVTDLSCLNSLEKKQCVY